MKLGTSQQNRSSQIRRANRAIYLTLGSNDGCGHLARGESYEDFRQFF